MLAHLFIYFKLIKYQAATLVFLLFLLQNKKINHCFKKFYLLVLISNDLIKQGLLNVLIKIAEGKSQILITESKHVATFSFGNTLNP